MAQPINELERQHLLLQIKSTPGALKAIADNMASPNQGRALRGGDARNQFRRPVADVLAPLGITIPHDYAVTLDAQGNPDISRDSFLKRNADWIFPVAGIGGGAGAAAALGGAGGFTALGAAGAGAPGVGGQILDDGTVAAGGASSGLDAVKKGTDVVRQTQDWTKILGPLIGLGVQGATGGFSGNQNTPAMDPAIQAQIAALLKQQQDRSARTTPVHEAAMRLAQQLAPTATNTPRIQAAIDRTAAPAPSAQTDPQVLDAIQRLMGR